MYRPQFAYSDPPEGYADEEFSYYFDGTNTPALNGTLTPGQQINNIPLPTQMDADFIWRATLVDDPDNMLGLQFETPWGDFLSDDFVPVSQSYGGIAGAIPGVPGNQPVPLEAEIILPRGSVVRVNVTNLS